MEYRPLPLAWLLAPLLLIASVAAAAALTVPDDTGHTLALPSTPNRIISLAPGATEMLFAAGAGQHVIATVQYADEPAAAKQVPRIGDVVAVDMERLVALRPEVVVVWPGGGNPASTTGINVFHSFDAYLTQLNTVLNGTNTILKLVAVGHWNSDTNTFTAYRIDILQLP